MRRLGVARELEGSLGRFNQAQVPWLADFLQERLVSGGSVAVLGLSYKSGTDVIEASVRAYITVINKILARRPQKKGRRSKKKKPEGF